MSVASLSARLKKRQQERKTSGITSTEEQKLAAARAEREANRAKARETNKTREKLPEGKLTLSGAARALLAKKLENNEPTIGEATIEVITDPQEHSLGKGDITLDMFNAEQMQAVNYARDGKSFCLIGGAGTGKTTTQKGVVQELVRSGIVGSLEAGTDRVLRQGMPSVAIISFTNKAVGNIKAALPENYKSHCSTCHKLLEYVPEEIEDEELDEYGKPTGEVITKRRFVPTYGITKEGLGGGMVLPHLDVVIFEEAGSIPVALYEEVVSALPNPEQTIFIFLGDLNQLPPVFGDAILGYKLLDLPVVELVQVYRQAQLSPITNLATLIQKGRGISDKDMEELAGDFGEHGILELQRFNDKASNLHKTPEDIEKMTHNFGKHIYQEIISGSLNPDTDVVLIPYNKQLGTIELNKWAGQAMRDMKDLETYHVRAGYNEHFLCVGDKVIYDKEECIITEIEPNNKYLGEPVLQPSKELDRWGRNTGKDTLKKEYKSLEEMADALGNVMVGAVEEKVNQASHTIVLRSLENDYTLEARTSAQVNSMLPVTVCTVHKSQGSEWRKVYLVLHSSHSTMWNRELIYTGVTRARHHLKLYFTGERRGKVNGSVFQKGVLKSVYKGITLDQKLDYFRAQRRKEELAKQMAERRAAREAQKDENTTDKGLLDFKLLKQGLHNRGNITSR